MSGTYINEKGETITIELSQEEKDVCAYSPLEILMYYISYPQQLFKDAMDKGQDIYVYFLNTYNEAIEYYNKKYN